MNRRQMLAGLGAMGAAAMLPEAAWAMDKLKTVPSSYNVTDRAVTPESKAQSYNNFYEFGEQKSDPAANAGRMQIRPWTVKVEGLVKKPKVADIDDLLNYRPLESRVYRFRCVEAWSMVIPWDGYPLSEFINWAEPLPSAKYIQFISSDNGKGMTLPAGIDFPYQEGLRMDEAMHPLTLLTFGSYGEVLANQQGAPIRVVVPWKYGYKSPKSIVKVRFVKDEPVTTWSTLNPPAYGFYSNVNPNVYADRPEQQERLLNSNSIFPKIVPTQMFNGYDDVASLYAGMDLKKNH
jgi:sulfoxide reductase catalytic subunit YedY